MKVYISTWMYVETDEDGGIYPQVGGLTVSPETQAIYWRCIYCFFTFAKRFTDYDKSIKLVLFTNISNLPIVDNIDFCTAIPALGVEIISVPYSWKPDTARKNWFNQYYLFDILQYYEKHLSKDDLCFVIDSDSFIVRDFAAPISSLQSSGALMIDVGIGIDEEVSGLTRTQAADVHAYLTGATPLNTPSYFGGEFYGLTVDTLRTALVVARDAFPKNNALARRGELYLSDEAHFFSFVMRQLGHCRSNADRFAGRIWTSQKLNNTTPRDLELCLWHVPAEKLYGIEQIFDELRKGKLDLFSLSEAEIRAYVAPKLGVGRFYPRKFAGHIARAIHRKLDAATRFLQLLFKRPKSNALPKC